MTKNFNTYFVLNSIGRYRLYLIDTDTTRYHKNRLIPPIPILKYRYITTLESLTPVIVLFPWYVGIARLQCNVKSGESEPEQFYWLQLLLH